MRISDLIDYLGQFPPDTQVLLNASDAPRRQPPDTEYIALDRLAYDSEFDGVAIKDPNEDPVVDPLAIICTGNPVDGFKFIGPFDANVPAIEYAQGLTDNWCIADLSAPEV